MKKFTLTILAFLYLAASGGAMVTMQYCMGERMNGYEMKQQSAQCGTCGSQNGSEKECCNSQDVLLQIDANQEKPASFFHLQPKHQLENYNEEQYIISLAAAFATPQHDIDFLGIQRVPLFLLHQNFRI